MRAVAGLLFVFLGLVMGYLVLTGKFPNSGPLVSTSTSTSSGPAVGNTPQQQSNILANKNSGSNAPSYNTLGLPTMANLNDLLASNGGMR